MTSALFVTTEDRFFLSHRRAIAEALQARGFCVHVAARETGTAAAITQMGAIFHPLSLMRGGVAPQQELRTIAELVMLYARLRPSLVHHSTIKANVYGSIAARLTRVPAVVNTVTGLGDALMEKPGLAAMLRRTAAETLYARSLTGITVFQNAEQLLHFVARGWVRARDARLVRGAGVDLQRFAASAVPADGIVVLPARLLWDKGVGEFVAAARQLRGKARFVIAGGLDPDNRAALTQTEITGFVREGVVEWWGHCADMASVFAAACLVVLPSHAEGMPLALAEAQASGRACITTDTMGCREAILPERTGVLVPVRAPEALAHAIATLLADRERLAAMGNAARAFAETEFARERIVSATLDACRLAGAPL